MIGPGENKNVLPWCLEVDIGRFVLDEFAELCVLRRRVLPFEGLCFFFQMCAR